MYDFSRFEKIIMSMKIKITSSVLSDLKDELNRFFKDSKCEEVLYTNNTDRMFFGMCVIPKLEDKEIVNIINGKFKRFDSYYVEIDSKLLNPILGLTVTEILAILLHEVGHVVNNTIISKKISDNINYYIAKQGVKFDYSKALESKGLFNIGILKTIRKISSIFEKNKEEFEADEFVVKCGYGRDLKNVFEKLTNKSNLKSMTNNGNKFIVLIWAFTTYKELLERRRSIIDILDDSKKSEGSRLFIKEYDKVINRLKHTRGSTEHGINVATITEAKSSLFSSDFIKRLKFSSLKNLEDDLYEFHIRISNIEDHVEAMDILRSINMRINLIDEYIEQEKDNITKGEIEKLKGLCTKYRQIREELVRKGNYDKGVYGMFVRYPEISDKRLY